VPEAEIKHKAVSFNFFFILFMLRLLYETSNIIQYSNIPAS